MIKDILVNLPRTRTRIEQLLLQHLSPAISGPM